jgi:hypothetical protein
MTIKWRSIVWLLELEWLRFRIEVLKLRKRGNLNDEYVEWIKREIQSVKQKLRQNLSPNGTD